MKTSFAVFAALLTLALPVADTSAQSVAAARGGPTTTAPLTAARFELTLDGHSLAVFPELVAITSTAALPDAPTSPLNTVGTPNGTQTLTFRRAMTRNIEIAAWHELVKLGDVAAARKSFSITAYDAAGTPVARYHVTDGFPSKLEVTTLKAGASEVLMETVTFTCEFIQRVSV
jgi:phage tail-like protein